MLSSGSVLQQRDFLLHPQHFPLAQHNLISTPRQSQHLQITFLQTNIWTHRQNPQGALTPSHVGTEFIQPQKNVQCLAGGLELMCQSQVKKNFLRRKLKHPGICLYLPLAETAFATCNRREAEEQDALLIS